MHVGSSALSIIFHATLFSLLFYQLWALGKKHIIPFLFHRIKNYKKHQSELLDKEKLLTATIKRMDLQIGVQKKTLITLEKRVQIWYQAMLKNKQQEDASKKIIYDQIEAKRTVQEAHFANAKIAEQVIPQVFSLVEKKLMALYAQEHGSTELQKLILTLPLNNHAKT
ncbi:MAG: hypothetical protein ABH827_01935 [bacterium]